MLNADASHDVPLAAAVPVTQSITASTARPARGACRFCGAHGLHSVVDLGMSPLCENFLTRDQLNEEESFYPLHALVCGDCFLVQVEEYVSGRDIFCGEYAYFSSYSDSWLAHARRYAEMITARLQLNKNSHVVELASNDGYLLKNFVERGIPCLGIEPADNVAATAVERGVPTRVAYFGRETASALVAEGIRADLLAANNVLAHVPDINDFVAGMKILLADNGVITVEFPHAVRMIEGNQFDTIYQEHYCYFSFYTAEKIFAAHGVTLFDVEELPTHGGSLRIYGRHTEDQSKPVTPAVKKMRDREIAAGYTRLETYCDFAEQVAETKRNLLAFLIQAKREKKSVAAYGAPGKGNTLLNYCGVREDFIDYAVDRNPYKHNKFLPGTHIPVFAPDKIAQTKPDYILILPWNLKDEIMNQLAYVRQWGAKFVVPIPELTVS
ncbi:MAG: methyltransferase domain-containing protein [Planctomycetes bacterium]|nr:methyltransferase domain-containing protein [Planctomycetota bacterium]